MFSGVKQDMVKCELCDACLEERICSTPKDRRMDSLIETWTVPDLLVKQQVFYVPYEVGNKRKHSIRALEIEVAGNETMKIIRKRLEEQYGLDPTTYVIATVSNNKIARLAS